MSKQCIAVLLIILLLLAGCSILQHLGGKHSPEMVADMVELYEATADNIEVAVILKMWWLLPACLLGLGAAAFLLAMKQIKLAIGLAAGFGTTLVLSITVFKHFALIGYIVLAIGLLIVGYALYQAWLYRDGFSQLFRTSEAAKFELDTEGKEVVFGKDDNDHGLAGQLQNKATERLVLQERKKASK